MKHLVTSTVLFVALCFAAPATGWSKDKHKHKHDQHHHHSYHRSHSSHYCPPTISYRSYRPYPSYSYAPSYYSSYPYGYSSPSYYSRPSIGLSFTTGPSYATYSRTVRTSGYDDDLAEDVQRALARRGYYRGAIDGDVGPGTRGAIREYQYRHRLEVTGRIDRSLLRSLGLS